MTQRRKALTALTRLIQDHAGAYGIAALSTVMIVLLGFATPLLLAETIDTILGGRPTTLPGWIVAPIAALGGRQYLLDRLWLVGLALLIISIVNGVFTYLKGRCSAVASEGIAKTLRERLYTHLQHLPFAYHAQATTGDLLQRCTSDVDTVRRFLAMQMLEVVNTLLMVVIALIILLGKNVSLTLYSMVLTPVLFLTAMIFFKFVTKGFRASDEAEGKMSAVLQESLSGVRVVRAFGQQQHEVEKFDAASLDFRKKTFHLLKLLAIYWSGGDAISMAQSMITLLLCVLYASQGQITVGTLVMFTSYVGMLLFPIRQLGRTLSDAGKCLISMERIQDILDVPEEAEEPDALKPSLKGDIEFRDVCFAYEDGIPVLKHLSFRIPAGETVAVLGNTGSGKSTLMYLLQRLYAPTSGEILIGGVPIQRIDRKYLRSRVGLVLQEPFLYSKSIADNVGIAVYHPDQAAVRKAASIACAHGFIQKSERGYDTLVGERGVTLSGGQKQRIAIARTLMKDNDILIFDDSLSAVDTETDAQIRAALKEREKGVTTLIISHRVTTLSQADMILVLEDGRVVDQGTHQELCARPGLYQRINHIQNTLEEELNESRAQAEVTK